MKLLWCLLAALFAFASPVYARPSAALTTFCPAGSGWNDGCMQAPQVGLTANAGAYQLQNCWGNGGAINQLTGTTTDYTALNASPLSSAQPWNSPGCEYPIGVDVPSSALQDPALITIPGCSYVGNVGTGGNNYLHCVGNSVPTEIDNLELGPIGGHGCTGFIVSGAVANSAPVITIAHSHLLNDGHCDVAGDADWFVALGSSVTQFLFLNDTLDGNGLVYGTAYGTCAFPTLCNVLESYRGPGVIFQNTVIKNFAGRPNNFGLSAGQDFKFINSLAQGWDLRNPTAHGEFVDGGFSIGGGSEVAQFSNFIQTTGAQQSQEATWPTWPAGGIGSLQSVTFDHNFVALPFVGGSSKSATITSASTVAGASTILVNSITSGKSIGSGQEFTCNGITGVLSNPHSGQPSAGPGGGFNSTTNPANFPQTWGFDLNMSGTANTGSISDGSGGAGTQLNITTVGSITPAIGSAVTGTGVAAGTNVTAIPVGGANGIYTVDTAQLVSSETINTSIPNIYDGGWQASSTTACTNIPVVSWLNGAIGGVDLIFNGAVYNQVSLTNNIIDEQTFAGPRAWLQGGSNVTISAITAPSSGSSTMTISAVPAPPAMTIGQGIFLAAYGTQRMVITAQLTSTAPGGALGGAGTYTVSNTNTGAFSGTGHGDTGSCNNPAIFFGNLDPSGSLSPTQMNQWGSVVVPGC